MPQPWGTRALEQRHGEEILTQSRKSEGNRPFPDKLKCRRHISLPQPGSLAKTSVSTGRRVEEIPRSISVDRFLCSRPIAQTIVMRNPVACGTTTLHLPCFSEPLFADVVMCASRLSNPGACNASDWTAPLASRPKSISTSISAAASLFRMNTDVWPPGSFAAYAVALTPASCSFDENSVFKSLAPLNAPANLSPYATGSNT